MEPLASEVPVEELPGLGLAVEPEQPLAREFPELLLMTVFNLPDPQEESCDVWHGDNGRPLVVPGIIKVEDLDKISHDYYPYPTIREVVTDAVDPELLHFPGAVGNGNMDHDLWLGDALDSGVHLKKVWDVWPVSAKEAQIIERATEKALCDSGYHDLMTYGRWFMDGQLEQVEAEDPDFFGQVAAKVLDEEGFVRDPGEFVISVQLPREIKYVWERLCHLSQGNWEAIGLSQPPAQQAQYFRPYPQTRNEGHSPWY